MSSTVKNNDEPISFTQASDYQLALLIGEGSFGRVWYGKHTTSDTPVAIKVVVRSAHAGQQRRQQSSNHISSFWNSLKTEQAILQQCKGSGGRMPELYASFLDDHCVYLVMECIYGGTLHEWIQYVHHHHHHHSLGDSCLHATVIHMARQIQQTLVWLHDEQQILHGDLKPSNCLIQTSNSNNNSNMMRIVLTDFGSAQRLDDKGRTTTNNPQSQSSSLHHHHQGTTAFSAPEILGIARSSSSSNKTNNTMVMTNLKNSTADTTSSLHQKDIITTTAAEDSTSSTHIITTAVDWWALGCLLYALWTGKTSPFLDDEDQHHNVAADVAIIDAVRAYCDDAWNHDLVDPSVSSTWWQQHAPATASLFSSIPKPWKTINSPE